MEPQLAQKQGAIEKAKHEITSDCLSQVFNFLDNKNAAAPAYVMEATIGLMRKMRKADIKSVELYTKNYEGFQIGLSRLKLEDLNYDHCAHHAEQIPKWETEIRNPQFSMFMPFFNLLNECVKHAAFASQIVQLKKEKSNLEERIHINSREIERIEMLLKNADIEQVLQDDLNAYKQEHLQYFGDCREHLNKIYKQAGGAKDFFAGL